MLGDLSRITDGFTNKGLANSGLRSRAIRQAQIQDLNSLSKELNQSRSMFAALDRNRKQEFRNEKVKNLQDVARSMRVRNGSASGGAGGANSINGNSFQAKVINRNSIKGGMERMFELTDPDSVKKREFKSFEDLQFYLQQLGKASGTMGQERNVVFTNPNYLSAMEQKQVKNFF